MHTWNMDPGGSFRGPGDSSARERKLLLLVEDEPAVRSLLTALLERKGFHVEALRHGGEVDEWRSRSPLVPDLLLVDLHLPGEDGRSLIARLRSRWPSPALLMSGLPDDPDGEENEVVLVKPFRLKELMARIEAVLGDSSPR